MVDALSYSDVGATRVADEWWSAAPVGYRRYERTVPIGYGDAAWRAASTVVLEWGVKTRSGFEVVTDQGESLRVAAGQDRTLRAVLGLLRLREPVQVVAVVDQPDRVGFAYGTRPGHPVAGEEAFVVHRSPDGAVGLTRRSLTRPAAGPWRIGFPAALVAQRWYRRRYPRSLAEAG